MDPISKLLLTFVQDECHSIQNNTDDDLYDVCLFGNQLLSELNEYEENEADNGNATQPLPEDDSTIPEDDDMESDFLIIFLGFLGIVVIMIVLIVPIVMCMEKRKRLWPKCLGGHFAMLIPVNFLEERKDRLTVLSIFGIIAIDLLETLDSANEMLGSLNVFIKVFARIGIVLVLCLFYLPLFICYAAGTYTSLILGVTYAIFYLAFRLWLLFEEMLKAPSSCEMINNAVGAAIVIIFGILTLFGYGRKFYLKLTTKPEKSELHHFQKVYLKSLFLSKKQTGITTNTGSEKLKGKCAACWENNIYYNTKGFRYSLTILVSITVGTVIVTYMLSTLLSQMVCLDDILNLIFENILQHGFLKKITVPNLIQVVARKLFKAKIKLEWEITLFDFLYDQYRIFFGSIFGSIGITYLLYVITILHMLKSYKENVLSLHKQNASNNLMTLKKVNNVSLVMSAVQYGGYQVAYFLWGVIVQCIFLIIVLLVLCEILVLPLKYGTWSIIEAIANKIFPIVIIMLFTKVSQWILVKFVFLQDRGNSMGLDNRKGFYNMMYFMFFYNTFLGIFSCLIRIIKNLVFGIWFLPRLDRSIFPKTFEHMDSGFRCYTCLLKLETLQSNVIVVAASNVLLQKDIFGDTNETKLPIYQSLPEMEMLVQQKRVKNILARNRWFVAYTLVRNPQLVNQRGKQSLTNEADNDYKKEFLTSV